MKILVRCLAVVVVGAALVAGIQYLFYKFYGNKGNKYIVIWENQDEAYYS